MKLTTEVYVIRCMQAGMGIQYTAQKVGITEQQTRNIWEAAMRAAEQSVANGFDELVQRFTVLATQYQLVGESLKVIGDAISNKATAEELRAVLHDCPEEQIVQDLLKSFIILRRYEAPAFDAPKDN